MTDSTDSVKHHSNTLIESHVGEFQITTTLEWDGAGGLNYTTPKFTTRTHRTDTELISRVNDTLSEALDSHQWQSREAEEMTEEIRDMDAIITQNKDTPPALPQQTEHITLGKLLALLTDADDNQPDKKQYVFFDFCSAFPVLMEAYRGTYKEISIRFGFHPEHQPPTLVQFKNEVESCIGSTFEGYKGGWFTMNENTPVWVDNYGKCTSTMVTGVSVYGWGVCINTSYSTRFELYENEERVNW